MKLKFILLSLILLLIPSDVFAQTMSMDFGQGGPLSGKLIQMLALVTVLSLAPSILMMVTSFTRIVVVLSFLRSALGLQQTPPNPILISLAMFLTLFIMTPTFEEIYKVGIEPLMNEQITETEAFEKSVEPVRKFMLKHVREKDLELFMNMAKVGKVESAEETPLRALMPAFMISELRRAFEIGFLLFIPFLVIDMLVASVLMSMGMMMVPPVMISLPFKLIFFVMVDGWHLIAGSLVQGFGAL